MGAREKVCWLHNERPLDFTVTNHEWNSLSTARHCQTCNAPLPAGALDGLCPKCLVSLGLPPGLDDAAENAPAELFPEKCGTEQRFFADYELIEEMARGGMGVVFRARQISLNRAVAVKMILDGPLASPAFIERFHIEAEAAAKLHHPNIIPIYEIGEHQGRHFFSMKLLEGGTLAGRLVSGRVPNTDECGKVVDVLIEICRAVHHAHQRGVLHRDIKPGNILFDADGTPFVADFGLARLVESDAGLTQTGAFLGTPAYMAPEQATGEKQITIATDIYGLGAILYHALTGKAPFQGTTVMETLRRVTELDAPSPRLLNPAVERDLEVICLKCLSKDPAARYTSAQALAEDLERWRNHETIMARPTTGWERLQRWCRRRPALAGLSGAVAGLVVAVILITIIAFVRVDRAHRAAVIAEQSATEKLWDSYLAQARAQRWSGRSGRRFDSLEALGNAAAIKPSLELRNEAIACISLADLRATKEIHATNGVQRIRIDWTQNRYAIADTNGVVSIHQLDTGVELFRAELSHRGTLAFINFSRDGHWLAVTFEDDWAELFDLKKRADAIEPLKSDTMDFSPDSRRAAFSVPDAKVMILDLDGSGRQSEIKFPEQMERIWWSPDGRSIVGKAGKKVMIADAAAGSVKEFEFPSYIFSTAWQAEGEVLAVGCDDRGIRRLNVKTGQFLSDLQGHQGAVTALAFHPDGKLLVSASWDGRLRLWDFAAGKQLLNLPAGPEDISFSADGKKLAVYSYSQTRAQIFDVAVNDVSMELVSPDQAVLSSGYDALVFGPGGKWLMARRGDGLDAWDPQSGRFLAGMEHRELGLLVLFDAGRRVFGFEPEKLRSISLAQNHGKDELAIEDFQLRIPPSLQHECPPGFFDKIGSDPATGRCGGSGDGRVVAFAFNERAYIVNTETRTLQAVSGIHGYMRYVAVSPDGKLVATGGWHNPNVEIWNTADGSKVAELPSGQSSNVAFSPDGQWLAVSTGAEVSLWHCGDWQKRLVIPRDNATDLPSPLCFSPDGKILAIARTPVVVHLVSPVTGQTLAQIEPLPETEITAFAFNADGSQLAINRAGVSTEIWNVQRIRRELARLKLDW